MKHLITVLAILSWSCTDGPDPGAEGVDPRGPDVASPEDGGPVDASPEDGGPVDARPDVDVASWDAAVDAAVDAGDRGGAIPRTDAYPLDDHLQFNHLQALGTHNSYHLAPLIPIPQWDYEHLPLDQQMGEQGVRQMELDLYQSVINNRFDVFHFPVADEASNCPTLRDCLQTMRAWSDAHPFHHPVLLLLEPKRFEENRHEAVLTKMENTILAVWPRERLVLPDMVQGDHDNLRDAIEAQGWPPLGRLRGRLMVVLHEGGELRDTYTEGGTTTAGRVMFPDSYGDLAVSFAAYHSMNDPIGGAEAIRQVVSAGHLVRTRADSDGEEATALDTTRAEAALGSGAHFISTDHPYPGDAEAYGFVIPAGTPSRCNPITAPDDCAPLEIEDPARLAP